MIIPIVCQPCFRKVVRANECARKWYKHKDHTDNVAIDWLELFFKEIELNYNATYTPHSEGSCIICEQNLAEIITEKPHLIESPIIRFFQDKEPTVVATPPTKRPCESGTPRAPKKMRRNLLKMNTKGMRFVKKRGHMISHEKIKCGNEALKPELFNDTNVARIFSCSLCTWVPSKQ